MDLTTRPYLRSIPRALLALAFTAALLAVGKSPGSHGLLPLAQPSGTAYADSGCHLNSVNGAIQHVIYIQFDNVHFTRDNPNVPSDLEQMPNLLNFIEGNGTLLSNHHTPLIAHTANDILTSLTGNYPDKVGQPVANSFGYFDSSGNVHFASSFQYWTDPVSTIDTTYNLIDAAGQNTPAPWVPYTRAGCDVGAFSTADIELENVSSDIATVFGANSPQAAEAKANHNKAVADFEGISIHCAATSTLCSSQNGGEPDRLPQEPGGYSGFNGLFGAKYVNPTLCAIVPSRCSTENGSSAVNDLDNNPVDDGNGNPGFPGFDPSASQTLGYVAAMQESGVPITYAYIADAHDNHSAAGGTFGPGEAGYVAQLKAYNTAFGKFFTELAAHGITKDNTLFVITADENDHFVGGLPSPANCNGVTIPCTYSQIGEIDGNLTGLLNAEDSGIATAHPFSVHSDSAPVYYLKGNPGQTDQTSTRPLERAVGALTTHNPITGGTDDLTNFLADQTELNLLHMITSDPSRSPTFTQFANPNYFLFTDGATCDPTDAGANPCTTLEGHGGFAWNHGDVSPDINTTWLGLVGPGVRNLGIDSSVWSDHTDIRPTMMLLLGLKDDYSHDGRALFEDLSAWAVPQTVRAHRESLMRLAQMYKQINAPVGALALDSLTASTTALDSGGASGDSTYTKIEGQIASLTNDRNAVANQMIALLENAEFNGQAIDEQQAKSLIAQGHVLLDRANALASAS